MFAIVAYSVASSLLLVINKVTVNELPNPTFILLCQLLATAGCIQVFSKVGIINQVEDITAKTARPYFTVAIAFLGALYTNVKTLQYANVETFIVFRSSTPIVISIMDYVFLGRELPTAKSWASLLIILCGAIWYVYTDSHFEVRAYSWVLLWYVVFAVDQIYIKFIVDEVKLSAWGRAYHTNTLAVIPVMMIAFFAGEDKLILRSELWTFKAVFFLLTSCLVGVLMSYSSFLLRGLVTATSFTVVGTMCKIATVIINFLIWDKHASLHGIAALTCCILAGAAYEQSPLRTKNELQATKEACPWFRFKVFNPFSRKAGLSLLAGAVVCLMAWLSPKASVNSAIQLKQHASTEDFFLHWIGEDPTKDNTKFLYYGEISRAISHDMSAVTYCPQVELCLSRCDPQHMPSMLLTLPHKATISLQALTSHDKQIRVTLDYIRSELTSRDVRSCKFKRVILVMFLNKVYLGDLKERIYWFENIFKQIKQFYEELPVQRITFTWSPLVADEWSRLYSIPIKFIPFGVNAKRFDVRGRQVDSKFCDIFINWDTSPDKYRLRREITRNFTSADFHQQTGLTVVSPKDWIGANSYLDHLATCKFHISTIGMPGIADLVGTRYYEVLATGKAILFALAESDRELKIYNQLGLIDGEHFISFSDITDLISKLLYYKQHHHESERISASAFKWAQHQTWQNRAAMIIDSLHQLE